MSTRTRAEIAQHFLLNHNQPNYRQAFDEDLTPTVVVHEYLPGLPASMDRALYEQFIAAFRAALPDIQNQIEDIFVDGDRIAIRWTGYGTHTGADLLQLPARGKRVEAHGIYLLRFEGDKIAEVWNHWDNLNVVNQLNGSS